jgi:hypothetical protein
MGWNAQMVHARVPENAMARPIVVPINSVPVGHGLEVLDTPVTRISAHPGQGFVSRGHK